MYGVFGRITPAQKMWPTQRATALRRIVNEKTAGVYRDLDTLRADLFGAKVPPLGVKQIELALTAEPLVKLLTAGEICPTAVEINNALFALESCGIADGDARDILEDLLYSVNVNSVLKSDTEVKATVANRKATKYVPPYIYRAKLKEIMGYVAAKETAKLTPETMGELNLYAECNIGEANYILAMMYDEGIGVKEDNALALKYTKKAAAAGYPPAYGKLGDLEYEENRFDEAYAYYAKPGAIALNEERSNRMDTLFRAKKFAKKVCISLGVLYAALVAAMLFLINGFSLSGSHPVVLSIFIALMTVMLGFVIYLHCRKPLKDLRHWGIGLAFLFTLYLVFALI